MSTIQKVNFAPVSDVLQIHRRDFPLADKTLADPGNSLALIDGEWLTLDTNMKLIRATTIGSVGNRATKLSFPTFMERGRTDVQAMADRKTMVLWMGVYEFDTRIFDGSVALGSGAAITAMLQGLKVATIAISGRNVSGLVGHGGSGDTDPIRGYVTRLPANNGGQLRFRSANA